MKVTTFSSREFNQAASEAKRAANDGPVFITDRGKPAHVLLSFADYQRLTRQRRNIADALLPEDGSDGDVSLGGLAGALACRHSRLHGGVLAGGEPSGCTRATVVAT